MGVPLLKLLKEIDIDIYWINQQLPKLLQLIKCSHLEIAISEPHSFHIELYGNYGVNMTKLDR